MPLLFQTGKQIYHQPRRMTGQRLTGFLPVGLNRWVSGREPLVDRVR
jgi:hypothetical protein